MKAINRDLLHLTPFEDINKFLLFFTQEAEEIFRTNLAGAYLTGSLSYNAFNYNSSDIDLAVFLYNKISEAELEALRISLTKIEKRFSKWSKRSECTYTPVKMLSAVLPPEEPRPWYYGEQSVLYDKAPYGNEWIINNYFLYKYAVTLSGHDFKELTGPVDLEEVIRACIRDLYAEWEPKKNDEVWLSNPHYGSYFVINLCRILYTITKHEAVSKLSAAAWVKEKYGYQWREIIEQAENWEYGSESDLRKEAADFFDFVADEVSKTELFKKTRSEIYEIRKRRL